MKKYQFKLTHFDPALLDLVQVTDHRTVGVWALSCASRVLHFFEDHFPDDPRPQQALDMLADWIKTGRFSMPMVRGAALASHAAAREGGEDCAARSAARAAGQALAAAHVRTHAIAAAAYALQAIHRAADPAQAEKQVSDEKDWQKSCLEILVRSSQTED